MTLLPNLQARFRQALATFTDRPEPWLEMIRRAQDARFGDYQANFAMALGKQLNKKPQELAAEVVARLDVADLCQPPEVAGPGFINLRLKDEWLVEQLTAAVNDPRLGVEPAAAPRTYVIDYSAPNVAKPMHVGHIRSTVIGDALCRTLRFLGHQVISDNHIGDWGTQFGMIIYGYKHFLEPDAYRNRPVQELARLYRLVRQLVDYFAAKEEPARAPAATGREAAGPGCPAQAAAPAPGQKVDKKLREAVAKLENSVKEAVEEVEARREEDRRRRCRSGPGRTGRRTSRRSAAAPRPRRPSSMPAMPRTTGSGRSSCPIAWKTSSGSTAAWTSTSITRWARAIITTCCRAWSRSCVAGALPRRARGPFACSSKASRRR